MTWLRGESAEFELMTVDAADGGLLRFSPYRAIELRQARRPNKQRQEIHTYIHTYVNTYIHTYIHTHIQTERNRERYVCMYECMNV